MPKSKAVRELETLIARLQNPPVPDPKGGCFCLAREHPLSQYTPSCLSCALILCSLNTPYHLCPSCSSPLLNTPSSLTDHLKLKLTRTLEDEEQQRQRVIEEAKRAAGAFPELSTRAPPPPVRETSHKILSLSSGKQKLKIISHTPTPTSSRPSTPQRQDDTIRVPPPPSTIDHARGKPDPTRPWRNFLLGGDEIKYDISSRLSNS